MEHVGNLKTNDTPNTVIIPCDYLLLLIDWYICINSMHIVGQWCTTPYTESKETLDSVPIELRFYSRPVCSSFHITLTHMTRRPPPSALQVMYLYPLLIFL